MKYLKLMVIAMLVAFTFGTGKAEAQQVVVRAGVSVGPYYHNGHHYHHRKPYWRNHHRYYRYY